VKTIELSRGKTAIVDDEYYGPLLEMGTWYCSAHGYAVCDIRREGKRVCLLMHREVLQLAGVPLGNHVDHCSGMRLDNRRENLRSATASQNLANQRRRADNTTGFKGVSKTRSGRYRAYIATDGRQRYLGTFDNPVEAARAYDTAALAQWGEFARPNETFYGTAA
jgi:hypothetical protein